MDSELHEELVIAFRQVYRGEVADDLSSLEKERLKLSGLVKSANGLLVVRNRIYRRVFDEAWIDNNTPSFLQRIFSRR